MRRSRKDAESAGIGDDDHLPNRIFFAIRRSASTSSHPRASRSNGVSPACVASNTTRTFAPSGSLTDAGSTTLPSLITPVTSIGRKIAHAANSAYRPSASCSAGSPPADYEVAVQSRIDLSVAPPVFGVLRSASRRRTKQRAVSIDYPRSRRTGGNPSTGCNRAHGVGASRSWTPGAAGPHSPPLDSCWSALLRATVPRVRIPPSPQKIRCKPRWTTSLRKRLADNGVSVSKVMTNSFGARGLAPEAFYFLDPDKNVIEARYCE